jgi:uncharacterized SAM-binding protein YcdF (DUF218 family)
MRGAASRLLLSRSLKIAAAAVVLCLLLLIPFAGRLLHEQDELERADLIMVLAGERIERWLEAVDLYKEGWAPQIVLSPGPAGRLDALLQARGVSYPREGDLSRAAVVALGVPADAVSVLPDGVDHTAQEASALRQRSGPGLRRVIVVTSSYHTRRTKFAFRRAFAGTSVTILVRGSRYSQANPARWWTRRSDIRFVMSELPKFLAYVAGLGG